jgi:alpha-beta hydrolase superfamily lysophospholipase
MTRLTHLGEITMQHGEGTFQGWGGLDLYYQRWLPKQPVQAIVGIVHGLGGHSGLFKNVVQCLVPQGYGIYGLDLRGHGRSPGQRGYISRWQEFREDVNHFLQLIQSHHPGVPCFLWGHSLGGVIALDYALHHGEKLQGVIVTAPALGPVGIPRLRMAIGRLLSWSWPRFSLTTGLSGIPGSRDPNVVEAMAQDPLRHLRGTARLATEFLSAKTWVQTHAANLQIPLLVLHGGADQVALPEGSRMFFEQLTYPDKERYEYDGGYHEIHDDINRQEVFADLSYWLDRHLATPYCSLRVS